MKQKNLDIIKEKGSGFKVPKGYFKTVEDAVLSELITDNFHKKSGFTVPEGYFESLDDTIHAKLRETRLPDKEGFTTPEGYFDSLEDSVLIKLGKETPQVTTSDLPEGYFETFEDRVFARLEKEDKPVEPKVISLNERFKKVLVPLAVAASLVVVLLIGYNNGGQTPVTDVANAEVDKWIEDDLINLDSYEIAEVFSDVDLAINETSSEDDALLDYLNGTDVESMLLEN